MSNRDDHADDVTRLLRIQQRAIRRGARWWFEAVERLQSGDLDPASWIEANARFAGEMLDDGREAADLLPLGRRTDAPGDKKNGRKQ